MSPTCKVADLGGRRLLAADLGGRLTTVLVDVELVDQKGRRPGPGRPGVWSTCSSHRSYGGNFSHNADDDRDEDDDDEDFEETTMTMIWLRATRTVTRTTVMMTAMIAMMMRMMKRGT
ncbi:unnamed protein product [Closterium sp. NIES-53]